MSRVADLERGWVFEGQGLYIDRALTLDEWRMLGRELAARRSGLQWAIGDWLVAGARRAEADITWLSGSPHSKGLSVYDEAMRLTGLPMETLSDYYHVSLAYPRGSRFTRLSWTHHRIARRADDPDQRSQILQRASDENWTSERLRDFFEAIERPAPSAPKASASAEVTAEVTAAAPTAAPQVADPDPDPPTVAYAQCPHCQHEFPVQGHTIRKPAPADTFAAGFTRREG